MIKKSIPAFLALAACAGVFLAIQSMLPPPASASGIVPAIVPALVPTANKTSTTSTVFALASSSALTASSAVCTNANGDMTTTACTTNAITSTTPVTVSTNVTTDQQLMELSLTAGYLNSLGKPFRIASEGVYTTQTGQTPTLTFKAKLCTVSGCGSGTVVTLVSITTTATNSAQTNLNWGLNLNMATAATGATGNLETHGLLNVDLSTSPTAADAVFGDTNTAVSSNIDLTAALFLDWTVAFSTNAATANTCQQRLGIINPGGTTAGGGGSGAVTQISKQTLGSPAASVTFNAIPGTYTHLRLTMLARSDQAVLSEAVFMQFNGDTGSNYDREFNTSTNTSNAGGIGQQVTTAQVFVGGMIGTTGLANAATPVDINILNYAQTTFFKNAIIGSGSANDGANMVWAPEWFDWRSTAAITSILLQPSAGNFVTGSIFVLYGIN